MRSRRCARCGATAGITHDDGHRAQHRDCLYQCAVAPWATGTHHSFGCLWHPSGDPCDTLVPRPICAYHTDAHNDDRWGRRYPRRTDAYRGRWHCLAWGIAHLDRVVCDCCVHPRTHSPPADRYRHRQGTTDEWDRSMHCGLVVWRTTPSR